MIDSILFAISLAFFACAICWVGIVYRSTRRIIRCRCGRTVRRVSLINFPDVARYSLKLTEECPGCHCSPGSQPARSGVLTFVLRPLTFDLQPSTFTAEDPHADL